jgi:glutaredoxin
MSRHCLTQLAKQAKTLEAKGIVVVAVQVSKMDQNALDEYMKKYNVPFSIGMIQGDEAKTRFAWGVRSLPWLILTDKKHVARAEGLSLTDLGAKIETLNE